MDDTSSIITPQQLALSALLIALSLILFWPSFTYDFINFDDDVYIYSNPNVLSGLSLDSAKWAFTNTTGGHWHPLAWISHLVDVELFGVSPSSFHAVNVAIHTLNATFLFWIFTYATRKTFLCFTIAALFALHPLRLESVVWVSQRKDVLSMLFALVSIASYMAHRNTTTYLRWSWLFLSITTFACGLLTKPTIVTLPALLVLLDVWPLQVIMLRSNTLLLDVSRSIAAKTPYWLLALLQSYMTFTSQSHEGAVKTLSTYTLDARLSNVLVGYQSYLGKLFYPTELSIFYPFQQHLPGSAAGACLGLLAITLCTVRLRFELPFLFTGWMWFLICLVPTVGFIQVGGQALANRWTYLPHIGLLSGIVFSLDYVIERKWCRLPQSVQTVFYFLCCGSIALCYYSSSKLLPHWKDSIAIFSYSVASTPDNFMAHNNLGHALEAQGETEKAKYHYSEAVRYNPSYPVALNNLGSLIARTSGPQEGEQFFRRALATAPNYSPALYNLGLALVYMQRDIEALEPWMRLLDIQPQYIGFPDSLAFLTNKLTKGGCDTLKRYPEDQRSILRKMAHSEQYTHHNLVSELAACLN